MNLWFVMNDYFQGEKIEALVFILTIGLLSLVFGGWLLSEGGNFAKGVAIPFLLLGLVTVIVGGLVGFRTPSQLRSLELGLATDKIATVSAEIQRMKKVNQAWNIYLIFWIAFAIVGIALRILTKNDFAQGLGVALVFFSGVTLLIDGFAERRASHYTHHLEAEVNKSN